MLKLILKKSNEYLLHYNNKGKTSIWSFLHKWNYEHSLMKNLLKVSNKILVSVNRYHVFRWEWMIGILGCATGYAFSQFQDFYFKMKIGLKPTVSSLLAQGVLRNQVVANSLKDVITANVCQNSDIQLLLHDALMFQVLNPNKDRIKQLITNALNLLQKEETKSVISQSLAKNISVLNKPIKDAALTFLNSQKMDEICAKGISSVLSGLYLKTIIANQANVFLKAYLMDHSNRQFVYNRIRQTIIL